jgi:hypothetical protein
MTSSAFGPCAPATPRANTFCQNFYAAVKSGKATRLTSVRACNTSGVSPSRFQYSNPLPLGAGPVARNVVEAGRRTACSDCCRPIPNRSRSCPATLRISYNLRMT